MPHTIQPVRLDTKPVMLGAYSPQVLRGVDEGAARIQRRPEQRCRQEKGRERGLREKALGTENTGLEIARRLRESHKML